MKRLILVLVVGVLLLVGCQAAPEVVSPTPTEVVKPTPEPTATPTLTATLEPTATPTPVLPTPTPESKYIGLPAAEVEQLREKCLRENPDSLCLPLPVDPTQPGVEILTVYLVASWVQIGENWMPSSDVDKENTKIVFKVPAGTVVMAPVSGEILYFGREYGGEGEGFYNPTLRFDGGKELILIFNEDAFRLTQEELFDGFVPLGTVLFTIRKPNPLVEENRAYLDYQTDQPVEFQLMLWLWKPDEGEFSIPITEADLLTDDQGRIVYIQP